MKGNAFEMVSWLRPRETELRCFPIETNHSNKFGQLQNARKELECRNCHDDVEEVGNAMLLHVWCDDRSTHASGSIYHARPGSKE